MRYRLLLLSALAALCSLFACNELEGEFGCSQLSYEVESITTTSATLIATIDSSDYKAIDQMGFMVAVNDCSASELQCAAFVICHEQEKGHKPEARDLISVSELEKLTGFTYFPNVPNAPKSTYNANDWL